MGSPRRVVARREASFRGGIASQRANKKFPTSLSVPSRREFKGRREERDMYTGTLIEDLIATVERAERHASTNASVPEPELWMLAGRFEVGVEPNLLGVA